MTQKLRYVRSGFGSTFDYFALGVKDGNTLVVEGNSGQSGM